jgi:hypothetical protein
MVTTTLKCLTVFAEGLSILNEEAQPSRLSYDTTAVFRGTFGVSTYKWRTEDGFGGSNFPPPPKFRSFDKTESNSQFRGKYIRNNLITVRVLLICKLNGTPEYETTAPRSLFSLPCPQLNVLNPPSKKNSWVRHCNPPRLDKAGGRPLQFTWNLVEGIRHREMCVMPLFKYINYILKKITLKLSHSVVEETITVLGR